MKNCFNLSGLNSFITFAFAFSISGQVLANSTPSKAATGSTTQISAEDQAILDRGEISTGQYVGGGIASTLIGFGLGHQIQGRFESRGWIFTLAEVASLASMIVGFGECGTKPAANASPDSDSNSTSINCSGFDKTIIVGGALLFTGLRIWEIIDAWVVPPMINDDYHRVRSKIHQANATHIMILPVVVRKTPGLSLAMTF